MKKGHGLLGKPQESQSQDLVQTRKQRNRQTQANNEEVVKRRKLANATIGAALQAAKIRLVRFQNLPPAHFCQSQQTVRARICFGAAVLWDA